MSWLSRFTNVFRSEKVSGDLDEELQFHLEERTRQLVESGLTREEAEREAGKHLGNPLLLRESSREVKLLPWLDSIVQDTRIGLRMLAKSPAVTAAALGSLSLAMGACLAAFSLINALILRELPVRQPDRLIYITCNEDAENPQREADTFSYPLFERLRDAARPQADLFATSHQGALRRVLFQGSGQEEKIRPQWISGNAFQILGIKPAIGRLLADADDQRPGDHPVAVLSHSFWTRRFNSDPSVLGRWFTLAESQYQVIGVAQKGFTGVEPGMLTDLWLPNMMWKERSLKQAGWNWLRIWGRLKPEVQQEEVRQVLQAPFINFRRERAQEFPPELPRERLQRFLDTTLHVRSAANGPSMLRESFTRPMWILAAVVGLLLLIACSNVANLFLARGAAREREMGLRVSIGAGRKRLIQQVLIESGMLAVAACAIGLAFAFLVGPAIVHLLSTSENPAYLELRLDAGAAAFAAGLCGLTVILFGLAPALRASNVSPNNALKKAGGTLSRTHGILRPLIAFQVGFSFIVLFVSGLLLISFRKLVTLDTGFDKSGVILFEIEALDLREEKAGRAPGLQLLDRMRGLPGVRSASLSAWPLFRGWGWKGGVRIPGREPELFEPHFLAVSPGFFETMRIKLLDGREFEARDSEPEAPSAAIVNQAFARMCFPGEQALGRRLDQLMTRDSRKTLEIIGVVGDAKYRDLREPPPPTVYIPLRAINGTTLEVRTALDPLSMAAAWRDEIERVHPAFHVSDITLQSTWIDNVLIRERLLALLSGFFAIVALVLAGVGLYGVLSYSVVQRTKEIGIRVALGAQPSSVVRLVVTQVIVVALLGLGAGIAGGYGLAQFLATLLFEIQPSDFVAVALPLGFLLSAAALAALPPALRATRLDPLAALRHE